MRTLVERILSAVFPPLLDQRLTTEELEASLDYRRRDRRTQPYYVWSSAGNLREHPEKPRPTTQERRNRDIPIKFRFSGKLYSSVLAHANDICKADGAGPETSEGNS
jgi:hypothetical protein